MAEKVRSRRADYAVYVLVRCLICLLQVMPVSWALGVSRLMAWLAYRIDKRHRLVAAENIRHAFPDHSESEIDALVRGCYRHVCAMAVESVILMRRMKPDNAGEFVRDEDADDQRSMWQLTRSQRPTLILTGHVGNWEAMSMTIAREGGEGGIIAREIDNPYLDAYVRRVRSMYGVLVVEKHGATNTVAALLERGGNVGLVGDQDAGAKGLFVPFFGRPASTHKSIALLSLQFQAPIIVLGCLRTGEPLKHVLFLEDAIMPEDYANDPRAVANITRRYTEAIESIVRRCPEQYFWLHRRWKHQPKAKGARAA